MNHSVGGAEQKERSIRVGVIRRVFCLGLLCAGVVGVLFLFFSRQSEPAKLSDGEQVAIAPNDQAAASSFAQLEQLLEVPDLNGVSAETASDIRTAVEQVRLRPNDANALGQLGRVFQSHQYLGKALMCYARASSLAPSAFEWHYYTGRVHADLFELELAIVAYEKAAKLNPNYAPAYLALGNLYYQSGDVDSASDSFRRFSTLRPQSSHGIVGLAQIAFDKNEFESVIDLLGRNTATQPSDFRVNNLLGRAYQQIGQPEKARYHLAKVNSLNSKDETTKRVVYDDPLYHKMLASNTTTAAVADRFRAALGTGQTEVAIRLAKELHERNPNDARQLHSLAVAYKQAKRIKEALDAVERAIRLDESFLDARITKAQLLIVLRRNVDALAELESVIQQDPGLFDAQYYRGVAHVMAKQYGSAVDSFRAAVQLENDSARAHVALAEALTQSGNRSEAIVEYRRALELDPSNARAIQQLGQKTK